MSTKSPVAFLGTGLMGFPMARRLLLSGFPLAVWNRTREKALPLAQQGATLAASPSQALAEAEVAVLMLADATAIHGALIEAAAPLAGKTIVQMGTIAPRESRELAEKIAASGGRYLEAPVLGSVPQATEGQLAVMVGGDPFLFQELLPLLRCFGPNPRLIGPVGSASTLKLALNNLIAAHAAAFATSLALVQNAGVPLEVFLEILRPSPFFAPTFERKLPVMLNPEGAPVNFPAKHMLKDVRLIAATAGELGVEATLVEALEALYGKAVAQGLADADYAAVAKVLTGDRDR
ncbi:MAG: NAD(P)-dependent oxidoreductase [Thermoanaerobaculum sp.]